MVMHTATGAGGTASRVVPGPQETPEALQEALLGLQEESE
jgi:hypothetical protein